MKFTSKATRTLSPSKATEIVKRVDIRLEYNYCVCLFRNGDAYTVVVFDHDNTMVFDEGGKAYDKVNGLIRMIEVIDAYIVKGDE